MASCAVFGGSDPRAEVSSAVFALTPAESKRLIAKGVANLPEVKAALQKGRVVIATGSTTGYVAEEILGRQFERKKFLSGHIFDGLLCAMGDHPALYPFVIIDGQVIDVPPEDILPDFEATDVFIKSANAVDINGHAGVLMANELGGTIGMALGILTSRGANLIVPVGMEKMIPSVTEASRRLGTRRVKYGLESAALEGKIGLMPLVTATVITEVTALHRLCDVEVFHIASGGIGGSEGSVVLLIEGKEENVQSALSLIKEIKGEPPFGRPY
ncbi:MAG TPA: hypothetical protein GXZ96_04985 [Firmicutes bacterium]|jgi:hypothetical protein|nr:hypothetical protein [Bacillota bacterium]